MRFVNDKQFLRRDLFLCKCIATFPPKDGVGFGAPLIKDGGRSQMTRWGAVLLSVKLGGMLSVFEQKE